MRREALASEPSDPLRAWAHELAADAALQAQAIDVEQLASMAVAKWGRGNRYERPPFETPPEVELVGHLERVADSGALLMLRGFAAVAGGPVASAASAAGDRLAAAGILVPSWAAGIGACTPSGAWIVRDREWDDGVSLFAEFDVPGGPTHTVAVFVDHNLGPQAKIIGLTRSMRETFGDGCDLGEPEPVSLAEMGERLRRALAAVHPLQRRGSDNEDAMRYALACARADALPGGFELPSSEVTPDERFALLAEFLESGEGSMYREDIDAQTVVALAIDHRAGCDGRPLRWSPIAVERFLCSWLLDEAPDQREVVGRVGEVLGAWVVYCGRQCGAPRERVLEVVEAVETLADEILAAAR